MIDFNGTISGFTITSANVDERDALWEVVDSISGLLIGDKGFIRPLLKQEFPLAAMLSGTLRVANGSMNNNPLRICRESLWKRKNRASHQRP